MLENGPCFPSFLSISLKIVSIHKNLVDNIIILVTCHDSGLVAHVPRKRTDGT